MASRSQTSRPILKAPIWDELNFFSKTLRNYPVLTEEFQNMLLIKMKKGKESERSLKNLRRAYNAKKEGLENKKSRAKSKELIHSLNKTETEMQELEELVKAGEESRNALILSNLRLAIKIIFNSKIRGLSEKFGIDPMDLIQEANLALTRALNYFDINLGPKFSTYAYHSMYNNVLEYVLRNGSPVQIPASHFRSLKKFKTAMGNTEVNGVVLEEEQMNENPDNEMRQLLMKGFSNLRHGIQNAQCNTPFQEGKTEKRFRMIDPEEEIINKISKDQIIEFLASDPFEINKREKQVAMARLEGESLQQIADTMNLTESRIAQIEADVVSKLHRILCKPISGFEKPTANLHIEEKIAFLKGHNIPQEIWAEWNLKLITGEMLRKIVPEAIKNGLVNYLPFDTSRGTTLYCNFGVKEVLSDARERKAELEENKAPPPINKSKGREFNRQDFKKIAFLENHSIPREIYEKWNLKSIDLAMLERIIPKALEQDLIPYLPFEREDIFHIYYSKGVARVFSLAWKRKARESS
ncbi:MAG: sigma-70 family RNA polymerase sigma factor [Candidatus Micrarchaeia archaeon]